MLSRLKILLITILGISILASGFSFDRPKFRLLEAHATVPTTTVVDAPRIAQKVWRIAKDAMLAILKREILQKITDQTVEWIQNGMEGKPMFVTDWKKFAKEAVNRGIGDAIGNDPTLSFLCSPFRANLKLSLPLVPVPKFYEEGECTWDDIKVNYKNFAKDFRAGIKGGEWLGYHSVWQPNNNFISAGLIGEFQIASAQAETRELDLIKASSGGGFLGMGKPGEPITTPGSIVGAATAKALGAGQESILSAREITEMVGAIVDALYNLMMKKGAKGLANKVYKSEETKQAVTQKWESEVDSIAKQNLESVHSFYIDQITAVLSPRRKADSIVDQTINLVNNFKDPDLSKHCAAYPVSPKKTASEIQTIIYGTLRNLAQQFNSSALAQFTGTPTSSDLAQIIIAFLEKKKKEGDNQIYLQLLPPARDKVDSIAADATKSASNRTSLIGDAQAQLENDARQAGIGANITNGTVAEAYLTARQEDADIKTIKKAIADANKEICD